VPCPEMITRRKGNGLELRYVVALSLNAEQLSLGYSLYSIDGAHDFLGSGYKSSRLQRIKSTLELKLILMKT
jgi:hypothetical protein